MSERITVRSQFEEVKAALLEHGYTDLATFIDGRIAQTVKKNSGERKPTPRQTENEKIKVDLLNSMEVGEQYSIGDMLTRFDCFPAEMTPQRLSALLSQLGAKGTGEIKRTESKGKAYFSLA